MMVSIVRVYAEEGKIVQVGGEYSSFVLIGALL
jgi:hypothetical protein